MENQKNEEEEDLEGIDPTNPWHKHRPEGASRLFGHSWSQGFVAPYLPSGEDVVTRVLDLVQPKSAGDLLYDLGCGDGRFVIEAARRFHCRAVGIDLDEKLLCRAREQAASMNLAGFVQFRCEDLLQLVHSDELKRNASIIVVYLLPDTLKALQPTLQHCLEQGAVVVSIRWPLGDEAWNQRFLAPNLPLPVNRKTLISRCDVHHHHHNLRAGDQAPPETSIDEADRSKICALHALNGFYIYYQGAP